jgi:hypothetical protein
MNRGETIVRDGLEQLRAAARPEGGLEERVLGSVLARIGAETAQTGPRGWAAVWKGWLPVAAAGCAMCLLAGGLVVERETARVSPAPTIAVAPPAVAGQGALRTAGAERVAPARIAAGRRRGRATPRQHTAVRKNR